MDVKVTGLDEAVLEAEAIVARLKRPKPVLDEVAEEMKTFIEERFAARQAPDGSPWAPVTLNTALYRTTDGEGLMRSRYAQTTAKTVRYGARASFADVHQLGDGRVPARPFAPVEGEGGPGDAFIEDARVLIERWIATGEGGWRTG